MPHDWLLLALPPLLTAAVTDLRWRIIPNAVPVVLVLGCAVSLLLRHDFTGLLQALAVGGTVLLAGAVLFAMGWIGGGDVKLTAAVAAWVGVAGLGEFLTVMALAGGLLALAMLAGEALTRLLGRARADRARRGVPYGLAIVAAAVWTLAGQAP
jgi:prepilin peptidase CpaA